MDTPASDSSWKGITGARMDDHKARKDRPFLATGSPTTRFSASTATIGRLPRPTKSTIEWLCPPPPLSSSRTRPGPGDAAPAHRLEGGSARDPAEWRGFTRCARGCCRVRREALTRGLAPWSTKLSAGDTEGVPSSTPELRSPVFHSEVGEAPELIEALASAMLSGETHGELEIRCARPGLYGYLQRAIAWFAGASGPFRCRSVTVFTPEADSLSFAERWTHALPPGLDALRTRRRGFLVSTAEPRGPDDELTLLLEKSRDAIRRRLGNLVLHADPGGLRVSAIRGEPGLHALIETPRENDRAGKRSQASSGKPETLHLRCERSLREFCELRGLPEGIRGPETWSRPTPWSRRDPGSFCAERGALPQKERPAPSAEARATPPPRGRGEPFAREGKERVARGGSFVFLSLNDAEIEMLPELPEIGATVFRARTTRLEGPRRWTKTENSSDITNLTDSALWRTRLHRGWHSVRIETRGLCTARRTPLATGFSTRFGRHRCPRLSADAYPARSGSRWWCAGQRGDAETGPRALPHRARGFNGGGRRRAPPRWAEGLPERLTAKLAGPRPLDIPPLLPLRRQKGSRPSGAPSPN
ncbi:hypothetical protein Q5P01_000315 [Channa striata]|uniref:Uncharacterized protein n=1 Tax=Channa striata TaxID=64152 RepID=A0AA88LN16_CHASR|nr:hypothetical protein Q5P01_000315 [Channa striata]